MSEISAKEIYFMNNKVHFQGNENFIYNMMMMTDYACIAGRFSVAFSFIPEPANPLAP